LSIGEGRGDLFLAGFPGWWKEGAALVGIGPADARESCGVLLAALRVAELAPLAQTGLAKLVERFEHLREQVTSRLPEGQDGDFLPAVKKGSSPVSAPSGSKAALEIRLFGPLQFRRRRGPHARPASCSPC
jgi:hypothetical protein